MSNFDGEEREFDELDLPEEDSMPAEPVDETIEFQGPGDMPELEDDMPDASEIGSEAEAPGESLEPEGGDAFADMDMGAPSDEFGAETAGEFGAEPGDEFAAGTDEEVAVDTEEGEAEAEVEVEKGPGFVERLTKTSPYVVLLGISVIAILIGIFCWFMELKTYDFQIKPAQTSMAPAAQSAPPSTTATV